MLAVVLMIASGVSVNIGGFYFTTRYFSSVTEAYNNENPEQSALKQEVVSATIDNTCVVLGITEDDEYIITPFAIKNDGFYSLSHIDVIYDINNIGEEIGESFYHINGKKVYYNLIKSDDIESYKEQYSDISFSSYIDFNSSTSYVIAVYYK